MIAAFSLKIKKTLLFIIRLYQKTLSPDHGLFSHRHPMGFCKFYPTCSQYAYQAIECFGVIKGGKMALFRVFRCNPLSQGGFDPVSANKNYS